MKRIEILTTFRSVGKSLCESNSLFTKFLIISLFPVLTSISGCDSSSNAQSPQQKWTGEWKFTNPYSDSYSQKVRFILTPEGKAYFIVPESSDKKVAYEIPLEKVSNQATLPANIKVITVEEQIREAQERREKARKTEGKIIVGSMNRTQQVYYLENSKFTNNFKELGLGIKQETEDYILKIVPQSNQKESVMNIAQAKREGLNSYVGLVYIVDLTTGERATLAKRCETSQSLSKPPAMPNIPKNVTSEDIKCPSGFKDLR